MNQAMKGAVGSRAAITPDTTKVLITPPAKTGNVPNRPPTSARRMSSGTPGRPAALNSRLGRAFYF
jgi:hypothetical protein